MRPFQHFSERSHRISGVGEGITGFDPLDRMSVESLVEGVSRFAFPLPCVKFLQRLTGCRKIFRESVAQGDLAEQRLGVAWDQGPRVTRGP